MFCHDHSNYEGNKCARLNCRYVHASAEEEREYRQSGYLPPHVRDQTIRKGIAVDLPTLYGRKPICKENLKVLAWSGLLWTLYTLLAVLIGSLIITNYYTGLANSVWSVTETQCH